MSLLGGREGTHVGQGTFNTQAQALPWTKRGLNYTQEGGSSSGGPGIGI